MAEVEKYTGNRNVKNEKEGGGDERRQMRAHLESKGYVAGENRREEYPEGASGSAHHAIDKAKSFVSEKYNKVKEKTAPLREGASKVIDNIRGGPKEEYIEIGGREYEAEDVRANDLIDKEKRLRAREEKKDMLAYDTKWDSGQRKKAKELFAKGYSQTHIDREINQLGANKNPWAKRLNAMENALGGAPRGGSERRGGAPRGGRIGVPTITPNFNFGNFDFGYGGGGTPSPNFNFNNMMGKLGGSVRAPRARKSNGGLVGGMPAFDMKSFEKNFSLGAPKKRGRGRGGKNDAYNNLLKNFGVGRKRR